MGHMGRTNKNTTDWFNLSNYLLGNLYIHLNQHEYVRITMGKWLIMPIYFSTR